MMPRRSSTLDADGAATTAYAFVYFTETPNQSGASYGLHLAVSRDGLHWSPLNQNQPVTTPTSGQQGLRDPFVHRKQDGTFVVAATDLKGLDLGRNSQYLHIWDSADLASFTGYRHVRMHTMNTHTWAPTIFWDAGRRRYGIAYSAAGGGRDVLMVNYTGDFRTVSTPQVLFDPGFPVLDGDIVVDGGTTYLFYKNLADGNTYGARSPTGAPGSFTTYTTGLRQGNAMEAPLLVKRNDGTGWWLWGDGFSLVGNELHAWAGSSVDGSAWTLLNQRDYTPPLNAKHGSIVGITDAEYDAMTARWGLPAWTRLKSWNFPDRYVRHYNGSIRLDAYPFDPHQDQLWRTVPGLAGSGGVSFESINRPGHYLRRSGVQTRLDPDDGTAAFRADATFIRSTGLADPGGTSLRSYNLPTHYLRHSGYVLRLDPLGATLNSTDRHDATFRFVS
ncbi:hypothetical protein Ait01nite_025760 [Actinoplanes italicus]|uniref:Alpha-L-arabinofuranosidase B-like protein n=1 Tax=Actinoplanes italicus TaxID=113567 RepID=A0A2T0KFB5_9ACTN|nr:glycoside hydrolase family 43 protein [Actinoplanes italicus]PRX22051.1 alpha-L-arabinofuranosidase B-like protein [Actinoplanes italicus]GIE29531.1 hypothetical protein Ait01nite_025760 [Actinoplanes italicus]